MQLSIWSGTFVERALWASLGASGALLAGAHLFEAAGYAPCDLCLDQREAHWTAIAIAAAGLAASLVLRAPLAATAAVGATAFVYALSAGLAFYHAGVEFGFWPGPPNCAGGLVDGPVDLSAALSTGPSGPSCGEAAWRFLGVSMAGYNMLFSAGLFALCLGAALTTTRRLRDADAGGADVGSGAEFIDSLTERREP